MTIYIDTAYKCHTEDAAGRRAIETDTFVGKCRQYIEGYRYIPNKETWTRDDGETFSGEMVAPWKDSLQLESAQEVYEELLEQMNDMQESLEMLGVSV